MMLMRSLRRRPVLAAFALAFACGPALAAPAASAGGNDCAHIRPDPNLPRSGLAIDTEEGSVVLAVEIAATEPQKELGLMCRQDVAPGTGMLFTQDKPAPITMWMKNTLVPLDMVFIDPHGRIVQIVPNAKPLSLDYINSDGPVFAVLELRGGAAKLYGLKAGDQVRHRIFGTSH